MRIDCINHMTSNRKSLTQTVIETKVIDDFSSNSIESNNEVQLEMSEKKERRNKKNLEEDVKEVLPIEQKEEIQTPMHL